jgi:DNA-binding IclR family transcriptional regulator
MAAEEPVTNGAQVNARKRHRMVDRVAQILDLAARSGEGLTLTELSRTLDAPVSSIQGLVDGLLSTGYLEERDRRYHLGTAPYLLNLMAGRRIASVIDHRTLESVHEQTGLTTLMSVVVGRDVYYIDSCASEHRYDYLATNYVRRSLIRTSSGWILLAGFNKRDLWAYLRSLPAEDEALIDRFLLNLATLQEEGICAAPGISDVADGVAIAVTEFDRTVAALTVVGSAEVIQKRREELVLVLSNHRKAWSKPASS